MNRLAAQLTAVRPESDEWRTPAWLASLLGSFNLDPASNAQSHIQAEHTYGAHNAEHWRDGLAERWFGSVFCNPPYSDVMPWAKKLRDYDGPWCALLKLDPSTRWYATLMEANPVVAPFKKRIKFEGAQSMTANFPSVLVYSAWKPSKELQEHLWLPRWT